jgi:hypothetical protein
VVCVVRGASGCYICPCGGTACCAARLVGAIKESEIWLSGRAKEDIDRLGAAKHKHLKWERHEGVAMKGFPGKSTLWAVD